MKPYIYSGKKGLVTTRDIEETQLSLLKLNNFNLRVVIGVSILISLCILGYLSNNSVFLVDLSSYLYLYLISAPVFLFLFGIVFLWNRRRIIKNQQKDSSYLKPYPENIDIFKLKGEKQEQYKKLYKTVLSAREPSRYGLAATLVWSHSLLLIIIIIVAWFSSGSLLPLYPLLFGVYSYIYSLWYGYIRVPVVIESTLQLIEKKNNLLVWIKNSALIFLIIISSSILIAFFFKFGQRLGGV